MPRRRGPAPRPGPQRGYGGSDPRLYPTAHRAETPDGESTGSTAQTAGSTRGNDEQAATTAGASDSEHTDEETTGSTGLPRGGTDQAAHSGGEDLPATTPPTSRRPACGGAAIGQLQRQRRQTNGGCRGVVRRKGITADRCPPPPPATAQTPRPAISGNSPHAPESATATGSSAGLRSHGGHRRRRPDKEQRRGTEGATTASRTGPGATAAGWAGGSGERAAAGNPGGNDDSNQDRGAGNGGRLLDAPAGV